MLFIFRCLLLLFFVLGRPLVLSAQTLSTAIPSQLESAFARANIPLSAVSLLVVEASGQVAPRLSHRAGVAMNPASVMKLLTTTAALDLLGPAYIWRTPVWLQGLVSQGVLRGNLVIQGQGDPKLVLEKLWLLLRRVQGLGVHTIDGNIVLDRSAFGVAPVNPAEFDGEPLRPYNASPDALLINYKSVLLTLTPDPAGSVARVQVDPPLAGVQMPTAVPLQKTSAADCGDYRQALKANFSDPAQIRLNGSYALRCGEKVWPVAYSDPASYNARAIAGLWRSMGGQLTGAVLDGVAPSPPASFEVISPTLAEIMRDINKFSNNVMAEQLFLTLGRSRQRPADTAANTLSAVGPATVDAARAVLRQWWLQRIDPAVSATDPALPIIDNGSGLSRQTRISAGQLAHLLQFAYASPYAAELIASLPIVGVDGTLKRSQATPASAHLKTGSLQGVLALAGYVHGSRGQPMCLVALVNHPNASAARPALDALIDWTRNGIEATAQH